MQGACMGCGAQSHMDWHKLVPVLGGYTWHLMQHDQQQNCQPAQNVPWLSGSVNSEARFTKQASMTKADPAPAI